MSDIQVRRVEGLQGVAAELAVRGWLDTHERGLGDGTLNMTRAMNAFVGYAMNGRDLLPVGIMTWEVTDLRLWVYQSWVIPDFRGRGVYTAMWRALVEHATNETKVVSIESATHVRNLAMRAIAAKLGRFEESIVLRFDIPRD